MTIAEIFLMMGLVADCVLLAFCVGAFAELLREYLRKRKLSKPLLYLNPMFRNAPKIQLKKS